MKKTMSIVLAAAMCLSMAVTAFAAQIEPRTPSCDYCGGTTYLDYRLYSPTCAYCGDCDECHTDMLIWECSECGKYSDYKLAACSCSKCGC